MSVTASDPETAGVGIRTRAVIAYVVLAYALMWLVTLPLWLSGRGLSTPGALAIMAAAMFTPALASFVVCRWVEHRPWLATVGVRPAPGSAPHPVRRILTTMALAAAVVPSCLVVATLVAWALGLVHLDVTGLSGVSTYVASLGRAVPASPSVVLAAVVAGSAVGSCTQSAVLALGEEVGWRGFLLPALRPLGTAPALLITGVIWALWHLPLILLGYEFTGAPRGIALLTFVVFCLAAGALLGWLRLRSGSVLPAAIGHGAINAWVLVPALLNAAGAPRHDLLGVPAGLVTSACYAALAAVLWWRRPPAPPG